MPSPAPEPFLGGAGEGAQAARRGSHEEVAGGGAATERRPPAGYPVGLEPPRLRLGLRLRLRRGGAVPPP